VPREPDHPVQAAQAGAVKPQAATAFERLIRPQLLSVRKPARYIGGEQGAICKDWRGVKLRFALCFPDLYEIGMSYFGREVLYQHINARPDLLCERAFLPDHDMQELMRQLNVPLWALESKRPLRDFDAIGISLTFELAYPSALALLELAGIPLRSAQRDQLWPPLRPWPVIIAGGQCMCNPEPVAPFFDAIVNGEGEEVLDEIADSLIATHRQSLAARLKALARIPGVYVPRYYEPHANYFEIYDGTLPTLDGLPERIARRYVKDLATSPPVTDPVQSLIELPADKSYIEVMRGCPHGCRFCQAGYITRPARARPVAQVARAAGELARNTGTSEVGLLSLSTLDHPQIFELVEAVKRELPPHTGVALPSLRADVISARLATAMRQPRETSATVAIEAGGEALRRAIRKGVSQQDIDETFTYLLQAGWHKFKLYFMCGFAGEAPEAVDDIAALISRLLGLSWTHGQRRPRITLSLAVVVPKPHTPLQWQALDRPEITAARQQRLLDGLRRYRKLVDVSWHDYEQAAIEALLARGGRECANVVETAWRRGQILQSDNFSFPQWLAAMNECNVSLEHEVYRTRAQDEVLPWEHISRDVDKSFLWGEWQAYLRGEDGPPCTEECSGCGVGCAAPVFSME